MKKEVILFLILSFGPFLILAQNKLENSADQEVEVKNYSKAIQLYEKALEKGKDKVSAPDIYKKLGDCYDEINRFNSAVSCYNKYLQHNQDPGEEFLVNYYRLALECGQVKDALAGFKALNKKNPENAEITRMIKCCEFAKKQLGRSNLPPITNQEQLNSPESEFGLAFYNEELVFSSQQIENSHVAIAGRTYEGYSDIYYAKFDSTLEIFDSPKKMPGKINAMYNEGTFTFHKPTKTAYISQCKKKPEICRILSSKLEKEKWQELTEVKIGNADMQYDYAHPVLTSDGKTMYFSSNMPGGFGGRDIWKVSVTAAGSLGSPENLGSVINSDKEEMFPYVIGDSILLFASDGHIGMGGLDIFYSKIKDDIYAQPKNIGAPINSTGDDFSIILNPDLIGGYFCSKRGSEENSDDIYEFFHNIFLDDIDGVVVDSILTTPLADVTVTCKSGDDIVGIFYTDSTGAFFVPSSTFGGCDKKHTLIFSKNGYISKTEEVPCEGKSDMLIPLYNNRGIHCIEGYVTDITTGDPIEGAEIKLTTLRNRQDVVYTDKNGYYTLPDIPSNDYLRLHVACKGYLSDSKNFTSPDKTQKVCMNTQKGYPTNFELYPLKEEVEFNIENIYYEFDKARLLPESKESLDKLVNLLNENAEVKIKINSHTDSRGTYAYNDDLSKRRGQSVVNYLTETGIASSRLKSQGYGEHRLVVENATTEEEHALNRRTTFELWDIDNLKSGMISEYKITSDNSSFARYNNATVGKNPAKGYSAGTKKSNTVSSSTQNNTFSAPTNSSIVPGDTYYRVQLVAVSRRINHKAFFKKITTKLSDLTVHEVSKNGVIKYQLGDFASRDEAQKAKKQCVKLGYNDCFIVTVN